jgi:hypothetical protein
MRPQLIMACFGIFIVGLLMSMIATGVWFGSSEVGIINQLAGFSVIKIQSFGGIGLPMNVLNWFNAIVAAVSWNYPYLNNPVGLIFKMVLLYPVTIGVVISIVQLGSSLLTGAIQSLRGLFTTP